MEWFVALFIGLTFWYWWDTLKAKEVARIAGLNACRKISVQFLDDTVAQKKLWLQRDPVGRLQICRLYQFEFTSDGTERYKGRIVVLGKIISKIEMDAYRIPTDID